MRKLLFVVALFLPLLLSCRQEEIYKAKEAEEADIKETVFRYLFKHNHSGGQQHVDAFYLYFPDSTHRDPDDAFMVRFKGHHPPVKKVSQCIHSDRIKDRDSGKEGLLFGIDRIKWINPNQVEVEGGYYEGSLSAAGYLYTVLKKRGRWVVTKDKTLWIS